MDTGNWTTEDWKAFFIRWEDEQYHEQNLDAIDEYYSPDLVDHHSAAWVSARQRRETTARA